ncbi:hypothetical protein HDU67_008926, partial [Dinochytrium kinnereticum]
MERNSPPTKPSFLTLRKTAAAAACSESLRSVGCWEETAGRRTERDDYEEDEDEEDEDEEDEEEEEETQDGLDQPRYSLLSYSIPFDALVVTAAQLSGPLSLEHEPGHGKYSAIVVTDGMFPNGLWLSTLTTEQWEQIYAYQRNYNVRLVSLNEFPLDWPIVKAYNGGTSDIHNITISNPAFATMSGLNPSLSLLTTGIYHVPVTFDNTTATNITEFLRFDASPPTWPVATSAGLTLTYPDLREKMVFYFGFGSWSTTCVTLSHIWVQWASRTVYNGFRRIYATAQIDDFFLKTDGLNENGAFVKYRTSTADMGGIISWQRSFATRLPPGSNFKLELAFNGNGVMEFISARFPNYYINIDPDLTDAPLDWVKPPGTGMTVWPVNPFRDWLPTALNTDPLFRYFANSTRVNQFFWCSHTFTHQLLNNNSYSDTVNEIQFNNQFASSRYLNIPSSAYSPNSMVTTGISGLFNVDAMRGLVDNGVRAAVGDSSRPRTMNSENPFWWPMITNVERNGFDGFVVVPRQALNVYFNTTNTWYNTVLFNEIYFTILKQIPRPYTAEEIMQAESDRISRLLFHQANLRNADLPLTLIPGTQTTARLGLTQLWCENVFLAYRRLANWPVISLKQDELTARFLERMEYETAGVVVSYDGVRVGSQTRVSWLRVLSVKGCRAPVSVPAGTLTRNVVGSGLTFERRGNDPLTIWVNLTANVPVTIT